MRFLPFVVLLLAFSCGDSLSQESHHTFALGENEFLLDGKPFQIIAGEMHFSRIPKEYWRHRLKMARAMGLNTVATYVFWNYHELFPGKFDFKTESRNIAEFIRMAQEEGLWVTIRPGPYACAEWEFGGYPWWLLKEKDLIVRSKDPRFLKACERYLNRLGKEVGHLQITRGGPIIMVQVENEYGSFGSDKEFMAKMRDTIQKAGFEVPLNTADGSYQCKDGYVSGVLPALDGEYNPQAVRDTVRKYHDGKGPFFVSEFYPGWLDNWGQKHSIVPVESFIGQYDTLQAERISVSLYVFHGGTNFGFMNGANDNRERPILPQPTSYDYDAPLDEAGRPTAKYFKLKEVIAKHLPAGTTIPDVPPTYPVIEIPKFKLTKAVDVFHLLRNPKTSERPLSMEDLDQGYGYVLYRATIREPVNGQLKIKELRDYALVFLNSQRVAVLDRRLGQDSVAIEVSMPNSTLDIFVENLGRINYGRKLIDNRKGITEKVMLGGEELKGWTIYSLPFERISSTTFREGVPKGIPVVRKGTFELKETGETFLDMREWAKGCVWINGHSLGRYWKIGPQQTLYVPGCWLRKGKNEIVIFEMLKTDQDEVQAIKTPILDQLNE